LLDSLLQEIVANSVKNAADNVQWPHEGHNTDKI